MVGGLVAGSGCGRCAEASLLPLDVCEIPAQQDCPVLSAAGFIAVAAAAAEVVWGHSGVPSQKGKEDTGAHQV